MSELAIIIFMSFLAGVTMVFGGVVRQLLKIQNGNVKERFFHFMSAFGGGILLAAVAFALIPKALETLTLTWTIFLFVYGTLAFIILDIVIARFGDSLSQFVSMLLDFIPEALVLGASFAIDPLFGALLALFIAVQNFPEGFNAYAELKKNHSIFKSLFILLVLSLIGVCAAVTGHLFLQGKETVIAGIMMFASGGIMYLIFQDVAPEAKQRGTWIPASGASFGFLLGMILSKVLS